jgi:hypothetical protein
MRFAPVLFASGVLALNRQDCFTSRSSPVAASSECADHAFLTGCLSTLQHPDLPSIQDCLVQAGCSADNEATKLEARIALDRCDEWVRMTDLRRRAPMTAAAVLPDLPQITVPAALHRRSAMSGDDCFEISDVDTSVCPPTTTDGRTTSECTSTRLASSSCSAGLTCSLASSGTNVCMELQDSLDTAGIIISIVFAVAIILGVSTITYLCCKDRKETKRLAAKAEATALARAATKKKRAAEVRAPLMAEQQQDMAPPLAGGDPFGDRPQH